MSERGFGGFGLIFLVNIEIIIILIRLVVFVELQYAALYRSADALDNARARPIAGSGNIACARVRELRVGNRNGFRPILVIVGFRGGRLNASNRSRDEEQTSGKNDGDDDRGAFS